MYNQNQGSKTCSLHPRYINTCRLSLYAISIFILGAAFSDSVAAELPDANNQSQTQPDNQPDSSTPVDSALDRRIQSERQALYKPFALTPHKPNYLLPYTYNELPNNTVNDPAVDDEFDNVEVKFQFSTKFPITDELFGNKSTLYFAYTNLSFWQAYNSDSSSPFRETNHEPEIFVGIPIQKNKDGIRTRLLFLGLSHQSNGRSGDVSRSWNRAYLDLVFQYSDVYLSIKPWVRIDSRSDDDNPDILRYMGHGEIRLAYATGKHTTSVMLRNNFHAENYGAIETNYSYPMSRRVKWFFQYFEGYGESLIDYNARTKRIGIGIAMTDWL